MNIFFSNEYNLEINVLNIVLIIDIEHFIKHVKKAGLYTGRFHPRPRFFYIHIKNVSPPPKHISIYAPGKRVIVSVIIF